MDSASQIALTALLIVFLGQWRYAQAKRNQLSWHDVVSTLQARGWNLQDVRSLRGMFTHAPFLVQLADYATEHSGNPDASFLEELRRDAFTIRLFALSALAKQLLGRTNTAT
jgi:hypothetical protein